MSQLMELYEYFYRTSELTRDNLSDLARRLSRVAGIEQAWQHRYLMSVIRGYKNVTPSEKLRRAIGILTAQLDDQSSLIAIIKGPVSVYSTNGLQDGDIVLGHPQHCERPSCRIRFVRKSPNQKYCCEGCRIMDHKEHGVLFRRAQKGK